MNREFVLYSYNVTSFKYNFFFGGGVMFVVILFYTLENNIMGIIQYSIFFQVRQDRGNDGDWQKINTEDVSIKGD